MRNFAIALLVALAAACFGTDIGLGPIPTNTTLLAPGPIGSTTPSTGAFTTLGASGVASFTNATDVSAIGTAGVVMSGGLSVAKSAWIAAATKVDVGTGADPATALTGTVLSLLNADATNVRILGVAYGANGVVLSGRGVGGTRSVPAATANGQVLCQLTGFGYNGTTYPTSSSGLYSINANSLWTASNQETMHEWRCTPNGSTTNTQRMVLYGTGDLCLGSSPADDGTNNLQVAGTAKFSGTTDSTTAITGTVIDLGGLGVTKNIVSKQGLGFGVTSTATAAGTTAMSSSSTAVQVFTGVTTQTLTLPAANVFGAGVAYVVYVKNVSTGLVTVQRAGSDTINSTASNVTSFTLAQWASCTLYSDGVSAWERF